MLDWRLKNEQKCSEIEISFQKYENFHHKMVRWGVSQASKNRGSAAPRKVFKVAEKIDVGGKK